MSTIKIIARGPVVEGKAGPILKTGIQDFLQRMVELGTERLNEVLRPRPAGVYLSVAQAGKGKASVGDYRASISSRVESARGIITDGGKVVYGAWLEGTSSRNQTTRFKGYHSFRNTAKWLNEKARDVGNEKVNLIARRLNT